MTKALTRQTGSPKQQIKPNGINKPNCGSKNVSKTTKRVTDTTASIKKNSTNLKITSIPISQQIPHSQALHQSLHLLLLCNRMTSIKLKLVKNTSSVRAII